MTEYYFLASLLPPLEIGITPHITFVELKELLRINLSKEDFQTFKRFIHFIDMENLRALWSHERLDPRGNYTQEELEEALQDRAWPGGISFPDYMSSFLDLYKTPQDRLNHFQTLYARFLKERGHEEEGFFSEYYAFEREMRLVLVGFRAKKLKRSLEEELQFEDAKEPLIAQILAQRDALSFEPPFEYKDLKPLFEAFADQPLELNKALVTYRFNRIYELYGNHHFSIDRILGFAAQLYLSENWLALDVQEGLKIVHQIEGER